MNIEFVEPNIPDLQYLWEHMRTRDKEEARLMYLTDSNYVDLLKDVNGCIAHLNGKPAAMFWAARFQSTAVLGFIATDAVNRIPKSFHSVALGVVGAFKNEFFGMRLLIPLWDKYESNKRWVKTLGFTPTDYIMPFTGEPFRIWELTK